MTPELRQLRYFVAVAEERHFGRAAVRLRIAQPGLSKQIKRLEESIGVPLFLRDKRHVEVTTAGDTLLPYARLVVEMADRAVADTRAASAGRTRLLKVAVYALTAFPAAAELFDEFAARFPDVAIEFQPSHTISSVEALTRRRIDVAIVPSPFDEFATDARYEAIGTVAPIVALPSGHRLAAHERIPRSELLDEPLFTWPRELNPKLVDHMRVVLFGRSGHDRLIEVADVVEVLLRVAAGEGVAIVNPSVMALNVSNVEFRPLADRSAVFEYGLLWLDTGASEQLLRLVEVAREIAKREPG